MSRTLVTTSFTPNRASATFVLPAPPSSWPQLIESIERCDEVKSAKQIDGVTAQVEFARLAVTSHELLDDATATVLAVVDRFIVTTA